MLNFQQVFRLFESSASNSSLMLGGNIGRTTRPYDDANNGVMDGSLTSTHFNQGLPLISVGSISSEENSVSIQSMRKLSDSSIEETTPPVVSNESSKVLENYFDISRKVEPLVTGTELTAENLSSQLMKNRTTLFDETLKSSDSPMNDSVLTSPRKRVYLQQYVVGQERSNMFLVARDDVFSVSTMLYYC